jgi:hypothetical protein
VFYEALSLMERWINTCIEEYNICKNSISEQVLNETARFYLLIYVIDVAPRIDSEEPHLFESREQPGHRVALCHCWGYPEHRPPWAVNSNIVQRYEVI